jgi:hypothetical protein
MLNLLFRVIFTVCMGLAIVGLVGSLWKTSKKGWMYTSRLHKIPCSRCSFFTGDYNLKCTLHPYKALSEDAIDCLDYELD